MFLDDLLAAQKRGEPAGITSVCSAHPAVLRQSLETFEHPLIEATCNQVNQFGGYTGMTPADFVRFVHGLAIEAGIPPEQIILGGDHLGPFVWQREPAEQAMAKSAQLVADYARAGFIKLHLDCSMRLADDPPGGLDPELAARRAAELARVAEQHGGEGLRYVIGTEVPRPGGATAEEQGVHVTAVADAQQTIELHRRAFQALGLQRAWERVMALVVHPGVEFGDDFVLPYEPAAAGRLSAYVESLPIIYEAHSTDYQTPQALATMVRDHFAVLKVGPALTFAYREAIFALAMIEDQLVTPSGRSNIMQVLDDVMLAEPGYWKPYYEGTPEEQAFKRRYSLSDRIRYYWTQPGVQSALERLMRNLGDGPLPASLSSQFAGEMGLTASQVVHRRIGKVLQDYGYACGEVS